MNSDSIENVQSKDSIKSNKKLTYYKNGNIELEEEFYRNIPINNQFAYDQEGKLRENYFFDHRGNLRFKYIWDEEKTSYTSEGKILYLQGNFSEEYLANDTLKIIPVFANPFKSNVEVVFDLNGEVIFKEYKFNSDSPLLLYDISEGRNTIKVIGSIYDANNLKIATDSVVLEFTGR